MSKTTDRKERALQRAQRDAELKYKVFRRLMTLSVVSELGAIALFIAAIIWGYLGSLLHIDRGGLTAGLIVLALIIGIGAGVGIGFLVKPLIKAHTALREANDVYQEFLVDPDAVGLPADEDIDEAIRRVLRSNTYNRLYSDYKSRTH